MFSVLAAAVAVLIGGFIFADRAAFRLAQKEKEHMDALLSAHSAAPQSGVSEEFKGELADLRDIVEKLPFRWEEIRNETKRLSGRAYHHVRRVRESLAEHGLEDPDIESLAGELQLVDGGVSEDEGVPPVQPNVEAPEAETWQDATRRMKWGA